MTSARALRMLCLGCRKFGLDSGFRSSPTTMFRLLGSWVLLLYFTTTVACIDQEILTSVLDSKIGNNSPTLRRFHLDQGSREEVEELFDSIKVSLFAD